MDGFVFCILIFLVFAAVMLLLITSLKGKKAYYLIAVLATLSAWFAGILLDADIGFEPIGFLELRIVLPVLAMGLCIINVILKDK